MTRPAAKPEQGWAKLLAKESQKIHIAHDRFSAYYNPYTGAVSREPQTIEDRQMHIDRPLTITEAMQMMQDAADVGPLPKPVKYWGVSARCIGWDNPVTYFFRTRAAAEQALAQCKINSAHVDGVSKDSVIDVWWPVTGRDCATFAEIVGGLTERHCDYWEEDEDAEAAYWD